jgi:hypothetical protein
MTEPDYIRLARERAQKQLAGNNGEARDPRDEYPPEQVGDAWEPSPAKPGQEPAPKQPPAGAGYRFDAIDSPTFAAADYRPTWLVKRLLVRQQPCIVGGPKKALKTSLVVDLAISLGSGTPFLGQFTVYKAARVAILSGESGEHTLQETAFRVCRAKSIDLAGVNVLWGFKLPQLANFADLGELHEGLQTKAIEVAIIDPLYLCLLAGQGEQGLQASNLFDMGPLLLNVAQTCLSAGATPLLIHHARKNLASPLEPMELEDLAFAGSQEFARQWLLISRREKYEPGTGLHKLWLSAGGSVGHGGLWALDIDEGTLDDNFAGRKWQVTVATAADAREAVVEQGETEKERKRTRQDKADEGGVLNAIDNWTARLKGKPRQWPTQTDVRTEARLSSERTKRAIQRLITAGLIEEVDVDVATGKNLKVKKPVAVLRRPLPTERTERTNSETETQSAHSTELSGLPP